ncbi:MAG: MFS transporter [Elusimicrobiota bacterium]
MRPDRLVVFFGVNYFAQGMAGVAYEPVSYYLKDALALGPGQAAVFVTLMTIPLTVKPVFGLFTDFWPWFGTRRAAHLIGMSLLTSVSWLLLAGLKAPGYGVALTLLALVNVGFVLSDVVCDAVMVERGKELGLTGRFQAVQVGTLYATLVATGLGGGWLAAHASYRTAFAVAALFPLMMAGSAVWLKGDEVESVAQASRRASTALMSAVGNRKSWALAAGIFLWSFCPFLGTAQFYYQSEALGLTPLFIGGLATAGGLAGMMGAAVFSKISPLKTRPLARASIWIGAPLSLLYAFYTDPWSIVALTVLFSATGVIFRLAWMDLAANLCPRGAEATTFAAYMAMFNIAASASNALGGALYERVSAARGPYAAMLVLSLMGTLATLGAWPLLRCALGHDPARA